MPLLRREPRAVAGEFEILVCCGLGIVWIEWEEGKCVVFCAVEAMIFHLFSATGF